MRIFGLAMLATMFSATPAASQGPFDPATSARSDEVKAAIAGMARDIKPGEEMLYRPLLSQKPYSVALEYWVRPKQAAAHLTEAEFVYVIEGSGTLVSGGTLADAKHWYGDTNGGQIVGGASRPLRPGDVVLVAEGVPHWIGITGGKLVLLTIHLPRSLSPSP